MAEIINLNRARKARDKVAAKAEASANRAAHGRTKAERERQRQEADRQDRTLDGAHLDPASKDD